MADDNRFDSANNGNGGGSFRMGLLTGAVIGAGLGLLFAPKPGARLRRDLGDQASNLATNASKTYRKASETASEWAERGKDIYGKAREAAAKSVEEAQRFVRDATALT